MVEFSKVNLLAEAVMIIIFDKRPEGRSYSKICISLN